jgi:hypothetical protein
MLENEKKNIPMQAQAYEALQKNHSDIKNSIIKHLNGLTYSEAKSILNDLSQEWVLGKYSIVNITGLVITKKL